MNRRAKKVQRSGAPSGLNSPAKCDLVIDVDVETHESKLFEFLSIFQHVNRRGCLARKLCEPVGGNTQRLEQQECFFRHLEYEIAVPCSRLLAHNGPDFLAFE